MWFPFVDCEINWISNFSNHCDVIGYMNTYHMQQSNVIDWVLSICGVLMMRKGQQACASVYNYSQSLTYGLMKKDIQNFANMKIWKDTDIILQFKLLTGYQLNDLTTDDDHQGEHLGAARAKQQEIGISVK